MSSDDESLGLDVSSESEDEALLQPMQTPTTDLTAQQLREVRIIVLCLFLC
jgi:hypothetical protein